MPKDVHPACKLEKDNRQLFAKIWSDLGLADDPFEPVSWDAAIDANAKGER